MAGRVRHPIDQTALERYIEKNVPEIKTPIDIKQFGFGQSNPTYQLTSATSTRYVLRKKPPGKLLSKAAHKVEREHRIIHALEPTDVPVPRALCLCEDDVVVGTPFYIMEFLDGRIFEDAAMPEVADPAERKALWRAATQTLARLHRVDPKSVGLEGWEMSTVGHPLSDLCNFLTPYFTASRGNSGVYAHEGFLAGATPGLPSVEEIVGWYGAEAGWDPAPELNWGMAFNVFRLSAVLQGIAARAAQGQASSEQAKRYAVTRGPLAEFAWELVGRSMEQGKKGRAKL
ncbi:acyl-CoA dehydrogenase family member 11 [Colletotrichum sp. SAR 10_77]|nr:acyl-CoA dehydrogenase family member 11 [Colletotrichum sp. SAR 10_77]